MVDDPRVDVGPYDLQIAGARETEREQRVNHGPGLIAFGRTGLHQSGSRREVEARADNQHPPDAPVRLESADDPQAGVDDIPCLHGRVGAEAAGAVELRDGRGAGGLGDELLLIDEPHRAQVLAEQGGFALAAVGKRRLHQRAEIREPRIARRRIQRIDERRHADPDRRRNARLAWRLPSEKALPPGGIETMDQRLGTQRRLDGRKFGEVS